MLRRKVKREDSASAIETVSSSSSSASPAVGSLSAGPSSSADPSQHAAQSHTLHTSSPTNKNLVGLIPDTAHASFSRPQIPKRQMSSGHSNTNSASTMPLSSSTYGGGGGRQQPYQHGDVGNNSSSNVAPTTSIGRSQSAFNFILSKAKASFSSVSQSSSQHNQQQQQTMNPSPSLSSTHSTGSDHIEESTSGPRDVFSQGPQSAARSSTSDFNQIRYPQSTSMRSNGEDIIASTSSPTKRSIFGYNRERKSSVNSISRGGATLLGTSAGSTSTDRSAWSPTTTGSRMPFSQSPLGRGHRLEGPALSYGQFSKSYSDLHSRGTSDFPSPVRKPVDLPPVPIAPAHLISKAKVKDGALLQSPPLAFGFSRSVDDLSRDSSPDLRKNMSQDNAGTWGELGLPEENWGRPSDVGAMSDLRRGDRISPSRSFGQGALQIPFSSMPSSQTTSSLRPTARPQDIRTSQHLNAPILTNRSRSSSAPRDLSPGRQPTQSLSPGSLPTSSETRQLPHGVDFEGFLNRNGNISLPLSQLTDNSGYKGKEKDVGKGWKPYKVLMREGKLFFYKPSGPVSDEVKTLFPTGLMNGQLGGDSSPNSLQYTKDVGINLDDIKKGKLGTQELLAATSRTEDPTASMGGVEKTRGDSESMRRDRKALEVVDTHQKRSQETAATSLIGTSPTAGPSQIPQSRSYSSPPQDFLSSIQAPQTSANEKKTRRMTALFRGAVRPIMGSSNEKMQMGQDQVAHSVPELLSLTPTQKPSLVINCGSSQVSVWNNAQRSFVFHMAVGEGGYLLLQASNQMELQDWCNMIEKASKDYPLPTASFAGKVSRKGASIIPLYGSDIKMLVDHEKRDVPLGLVRMLEEVEARGLREQGIYRISGAKNAIEALKQAYSKQSAESINLAQGDFSDIHTIAGAIKQWFRDLPEPAVPFNFYHRIIEAEQINNEEDRLYAIRDLVWDFPKAHFDLLKRISQHLSLVCNEGQYNLMAPHNIGLVFGTSLLNPPPGPSSVAESFGNIGRAAHIVKIIVTMHEWLFEPEPEVEAEVEEIDVGNKDISSPDEVAEPAGSDENLLLNENTMVEADNEEDKEVEKTKLAPSSSSSQATLLLQRDTGEKSEPSSNTLETDPGGPRLDVPNRERNMVQTVYLDATDDAIVPLQDSLREQTTKEKEEVVTEV